MCTIGKADPTKTLLDNLDCITQKCIILIDLGQLHHKCMDAAQIQADMLCLTVLKQHQVVIAHSSGAGNYISPAIDPSKRLQSLVANLNGSKFVFLPFTETEYEHYIQITGYTYNFNEIESMTNFNPMLLHAFRYKNSSEADNVMALHMSPFFSSLMSSLELAAVVCNPLSFFYSVYFIKLALNGEVELDEEDQLLLCKTIASQLNILYLYQGKLKMNFVFCYRRILTVLLSYIKQFDKELLLRKVRLERAIKGFHFEFRLQAILIGENIVLSYVPIGGVNAKQVTFKVISTVSLITKLAEELTDGTIYFLRPSHSVIDAVGCFGAHLLLIQISLQPYEKHNSKAKDLWKPMPTARNDTILEYYRGLTKATESMYVYLSPQQIGTAKNVFESEVSARGRRGPNFFSVAVLAESEFSSIVRAICK